METNLEVFPCGWALLAPHHGREALLVARPDLDLLEAAEAVAEDRADRVGVWLAVGRLGRPTEELVKRFESGVSFRAVIVQPFVIAQEVCDA